MHPAEEKTVDGAKSAAQIGVFATRFRNHGAQFGEGKRAEDGKNRAYNPGRKNDGDGAAFARHFRGLQENARADHRADNDGRGSPRAQATHQLEAFFGHGTPYKFVANCTVLSHLAQQAALLQGRTSPLAESGLLPRMVRAEPPCNGPNYKSNERANHEVPGIRHARKLE